MSQSAERSYDLLAAVIRSEEPLGLFDLAAETGLDKSTASRLLDTLVKRGLLARSAETRRFSSGPEFMALAATALRRGPLNLALRDALAFAVRETQETASAHVPAGDLRICVDGVESPLPIRRALQIGDAQPIGAGVTGWVLLAFADGESGEAHVRRVEDRARRERIADRIAAARERGWLAGVGEHMEGVGALAVPIFGRDGRLRAAVSVAGPSDRWTMERMEAYAPRLVEIAARVSEPAAP